MKKFVFYFGWFMLWGVPYAAAVLLNYYDITSAGLIFMCWWLLYFWGEKGVAIFNKEKEK